jgi:hypothetical protein
MKYDCHRHLGCGSERRQREPMPRGYRQDHPAKALVAAVLARARDDLRQGRHLADQAREWFEERDPARAWSYEWCCAILDLDPNAVRREISDNRQPDSYRNADSFRSQ